MTIDAYQREYERLRLSSIEQMAQGRAKVAEQTCRQALSLAQDHRNQDLADLAICNLSYVLIEQHRGHETVGQLQQILMRSSCPRNKHLAAYNISLYYDQAKTYAKGLRYARLALQHAQQLDVEELIARSHNLLANALLIESYFDEARTHYQQALAHTLSSPAETNQQLLHERGYILANLGYCNLSIGEFELGFSHLFQCLKMSRRMKPRCESMVGRTHLSLCYGYLEIARFRRARQHGQTAMECASGAKDQEALMKALYLLGETEKLAGNDQLAFEYFDQLQQDFHPENPALPDLLMATDARKLINLMV